MKRVVIRPGKSIAVSEEALARARQALDAFGTTPAAMKQLADFKGDITIGSRNGQRAVRSPAKVPRRATGKPSPE